MQTQSDGEGILVTIVTTSKQRQDFSSDLRGARSEIVFCLNTTGDAFLAGWQLRAKWDPAAALS
jgi:hypothetical protein